MECGQESRSSSKPTRPPVPYPPVPAGLLPTCALAEDSHELAQLSAMVAARCAALTACSMRSPCASGHGPSRRHAYDRNLLPILTLAFPPFLDCLRSVADWNDAIPQPCMCQAGLAHGVPYWLPCGLARCLVSVGVSVLHGGGRLAKAVCLTGAASLTARLLPLGGERRVCQDTVPCTIPH